MELEKANALVKTFTYDENTSLRMIERNGDAWFVAKDLSEGLKYTDTQAMTRRCDPDEIDKIKTDDMSGLTNRYGNNDITIVSEAGLYNCILGSKKKEAKRFKRWVTHEVLPSIRKTGAYMVPSVAAQAAVDPQVAAVLAQTLLDKAMQSEAVARVSELNDMVRHLKAENADLRWRLMRAEPEAEANMRRRKNIGIGMTRSWQRRKGILPENNNSRHGSIQILQ